MKKYLAIILLSLTLISCSTKTPWVEDTSNWWTELNSENSENGENTENVENGENIENGENTEEK